MSASFGRKPKAGERRFAFGKNWEKYLAHIDEARISLAQESLKEGFHVADLAGKSFLDVGSGSGLFSLAAHRLGARVCSFDYDADSVHAAKLLKSRYAPEASQWLIERASVLDKAFLRQIGKFDFVYSWGVLHHTGAMWDAMGNLNECMAEGTRLFISIYNDRGGPSRRWLRVKRVYNTLPDLLKLPFALTVLAPIEARLLVKHILAGRLHEFISYRAQYAKHSKRGMSWWNDQIDWIGGYPFECARPEEVCDFWKNRNCELLRMNLLAGGDGCNEFVFVKNRTSVNQ